MIKEEKERISSVIIEEAPSKEQEIVCEQADDDAKQS